MYIYIHFKKIFMSIPDKATYILYGIVYIALGAWALSGFLKITGSSKNFPKPNSKKSKDNSEGNQAN